MTHIYEFKQCSYLPYSNRYSHFYRPQTKFAMVMFLHVSVCPQGVGVVSQHVSQVSRPTPREEVEGSGLWGVSRPTPRGKLRGLSWGVSRPTLGEGFQAHSQGVSQHALR